MKHYEVWFYRPGKNHISKCLIYTPNALSTREIGVGEVSLSWISGLKESIK